MSKEALQAFFKMPQKFQDDVVKNMNWTSSEMEEAVDEINIDFEIAAFVASTETVDDIQLSFGYVIESSTQDIAEKVTFEDIDDEEKLDNSDAALGWERFSN